MKLIAPILTKIVYMTGTNLIPPWANQFIMSLCPYLKGNIESHVTKILTFLGLVSLQKKNSNVMKWDVLYNLFQFVHS